MYKKFLQRPPRSAHNLTSDVLSNETEKMLDEEFASSADRMKPKRKVLLRSLLWSTLALLLAALSFSCGKEIGRRPRRTSPFVPPIPLRREPVWFHPLKQWSRPSAESDALWDGVLDRSNHRFVKIENPFKLNISPGMTKTGDKHGVKYGHFYSISMHHQLHCLAVIRKLVYHPMLVPHLKGNATLSSRGNDKISYDWFHIGHCFGYLKQAIMCSGDSTLEYPTSDRTPEQKGVDGWGVPHRECRDIETLDAFIDEHDANLTED